MNKCILNHLGKFFYIIGRHRIVQNTNGLNIGVDNHTSKILRKLFQELVFFNLIYNS